MIRADLHVHSTHSDGTFSPKELVLEAKKQGLTALAITDHDAITAYNEAKETAKELNIDLITGVEISAELQGNAVHVLGYAFCPNSETIRAKCALHQERRRARNRKMLEKLAMKKMPIAEHELCGLETIGRPHIAMAMLQKGYVKSVQEAFVKYIGEHKECYIAGERWTVEEAISIIHEAGGKAVIAHPHVIRKKSVIKKLLALPFDGIEAYYCQFHSSINEYWHQVALQKKWFSTGGSDFHGAIKPHLNIGVSCCPEQEFIFLRDHFYAHLS